MPLLRTEKRTITLEELEKLEQEQKSQSVKKAPKNSKEELHEKKRENRYYLPVLNINKPEFWESKPKSQREFFTDQKAKETCLSKCCGVPGLKSGCCLLDPEDLEHVLGPLDEEWIKKTIRWFHKKGIMITRHDLVIDFEEGKLMGPAFFNDHPVFQQPDSYPIMRIQANGQRFACKFLNVQTGLCTIYEQRPDMCRDYLCQYIKKNFLIRDKNHPGKWYMEDGGPKTD